MFNKSTPISFAVLALLSSEAAAIHFRPTPGSVPWVKPITESTWQKPDFPTGYKVPNFGVDENILTTKANIAEAEAQHKKKLVTPINPPDKHPVDYKVPNFGVDKEIKDSNASLASTEKLLKHKLSGPVSPFSNSSYSYKAQKLLAQVDAEINIESDPICSSAGCTQYKHPAGPAGHPVDYFVPNFGQDHEIKAGFNAIKQAEKQLGVEWKWTKPEKEEVVEPYMRREMDPDIAATQKHLADAEQTYGPWDVQTLQLESDPICDSSGCNQYNHPPEPEAQAPSHPMDYPVPSFGVDQEILDNMASLNEAEQQLGHEWKFGLPETKDKYKNPALAVAYDYNMKLDQDMIDTEKHAGIAEEYTGHIYGSDLKDIVDVQLNASSDPIFSSLGKPKSQWTKKEQAKIVQYPDPDAQGLDADIISTHQHANDAAGRLGEPQEF